jgi:uncharacterized protein YndB with AHSA1/START domain
MGMLLKLRKFCYNPHPSGVKCWQNLFDVESGFYRLSITIYEKDSKSMSETFEVSVYLPAEPERVYNAWLSSQAHADFTGGGNTEIDPRVGGAFTAWDGYISGQTLTLDPPRRIVQSWRTTEFPEGAPDSILELIFNTEGEGMRLLLRHSEIPDGQGENYRKGWKDFYFTPMQGFFGA